MAPAAERVTALVARAAIGRRMNGIAKFNRPSARSAYAAANTPSTGVATRSSAASEEAEEAVRKDREAQLAAREKAQRRARWATVAVFLIGLTALAGALYQARETAKREALMLTSAAKRAMFDRRYDTAMRVALEGLPSPGSSPLTLGWSTLQMQGLEAQLAGAAQLSPLLRALSGHGGAVLSAAFSPDGARIVTASNDRTAQVWDAASGEMLRELKGHDGAVVSAAFGPDGARIVTASDDRTARLWDAASGELLRELKGHGDRVQSAAFSADGARIVTASFDRTARVWDTASGEMLRELKGHSAAVFSAAFSPDGARIVTASFDRTAGVWNVSWGMTVRGEDLVRRTCAEKLIGAETFTTQDESDPVLTGRAGTNPCERRGPFSAKYWIDLGARIWDLVATSHT